MLLMIVHARWRWLVSEIVNVTKEQARALVEAGFAHGLAGYPIILSVNGKITVVAEYEDDDGLCVWEFGRDGSAVSRWYRREA